MKNYLHAFNLSPVPLLLISDTGEITLTNSELDQLFEYEPGALIGQQVETLVPNAVRIQHPDLRKAYQRFPSKRTMGRGRELSGVTCTGRVIPLELGIDPVAIDGRQFVIVTALDISHRKATETRLNTALHPAKNAVLMSDGQGRIAGANVAAQRLFGCNDIELMRKSLADLLAPTSHNPAATSYHGRQILGVERREVIQAVGKDARAVPVEIFQAPIYTSQGLLVMTVIPDLTEGARASHEMSHHKLKMEALNSELSSFANSAEHDLKTPLTSVAGLLDLCLEDLDNNHPGQIRADLVLALETCKRSLTKIDDVLALVHAGRETIATEAFSLADELPIIWSDLTVGMVDPPDLTLHLGDRGPLLTERQTLKMILKSLLSNAIRYADHAKARRSIEIGARCEGGLLMAHVTDNGIGIPERQVPMIFKVFERLNERSGAGISLSLVRKQILRMGGNISVTSALGQGTTFTFSIPLEAKNEDSHSRRG